MRPLRILLVEDSPSDVRLVKEAAKETPFPLQLTVARDGVEAMDYLRKAEMGISVRPDLILLDLNLPRKSGKEVLAEVKGSSNLKQIPVIVMTSSRLDEDVTEAYALNANSYITKPTNLRDLEKTLQAIGNFWFHTVTLPDPPRASLKPLGVRSVMPLLREPAYAAE